MNEQQHEALRLADALDEGENFYAESSLWFDRKLADAAGDAAAELRRLYELNAELLVAVQGLLDALPSATTHPAIKAARAAIAMARGKTILVTTPKWCLPQRRRPIVHKPQLSEAKMRIRNNVWN